MVDIMADVAKSELERFRDHVDLHDAIATNKRQLTDIHYRYQANLPLWTLYGILTRDYPGYYVVRMHFGMEGNNQIVGPTTVVARAVTLEQIRAMLPDGLHCLPRNNDDDRNIIEVWI